MPLKEVRAIAEKIAAELGYELVDVELTKEPGGHFLRFYIDRPEGVSLNELEAYHRRILPLVENVEYDYMEVSSPGVDRPLKTERDFERAEGETVELKTYRPVNGAKQFIGDLIGLEGDEIVLQTGEDQMMRFNRRDVAWVKVHLEFDESELEDDVPQE